ncbi:MAG: DUF4010 domain-containing protein [Armatimonadetes bacterium]|nr:DUF4010 domain-containing protein [Armatimonadota bacterium]
MPDLSVLLASPYAQIALVLALSFLMGLEREEHKLQPGQYVAAGVRTFPLIALVGYMLVVLAPQSVAPVTAGLLAVTAFLVTAYVHKLTERNSGFTSEMAALAAYLVGALVGHHDYWIAVTIAVTDVLLLSAKARLAGLVQRLDREELVTFVRFLLLSAVILPILPNRAFTQFDLNPFRTWLVVVVVSGISYASYLLQCKYRERGSLLLSALLGGAYSSTITTIALARRSAGRTDTRLYAGAIVLASAVMYVRLGVLVVVFNPALGFRVVPMLAGLAVLTAIVGAVLWRGGQTGEDLSVPDPAANRNPLELSTAFIFGALFIALSVATRLVSQYLGNTGVYTLAVVMGVTDIDPFILGLVQYAGQTTALGAAALAIIIATGSNNIVKGIYAISFGGRKVGIPSLICLTAISLVGLGVFLALYRGA